jgi:hypothetical protein
VESGEKVFPCPVDPIDSRVSVANATVPGDHLGDERPRKEWL